MSSLAAPPSRYALPPRYTLCPRRPTLAEYIAISTSVGGQEAINHSAVSVALINSLYAVVIERNQQAIGMGRIVGDGAICFYIQDIAVKPAYQRNGVGTAIMHHLVSHISATAPDRAFIGLFAAPHTQRFYEQFGFISNLGLNGMYQVHTTS